MTKCEKNGNKQRNHFGNVYVDVICVDFSAVLSFVDITILLLVVLTIVVAYYYDYYVYLVIFVLF